MRDASSENDRRSPPATDETSPQTQAEPLQPPANSLTELAQLLAASIAQAQASRGHGGGLPTNADLTSLAKLVSAAAGQRSLAPVFNDGLSSLAYKLPAPRRESDYPTMPPLELAHDDEPMPIPSTWREPAAHDEDRWLRQQMGAALLGLVAGLMIVVPTVLWLSGWFDTGKGKIATAGRMAAVSPVPKASSEPAEVKTVKVQVRPVEASAQGAQQYVTGSVEPRPSVPIPVPAARPAETTPVAAVATTARLVDPKAPSEEVLTEAAKRIDSGDIAGARELLAGADDGTQGPVALALGETYDPNMLAAWGSRGIIADVAKARALYRKAVGLGMARAQGRLDALK
jgi:hypothetical protein